MKKLIRIVVAATAAISLLLFLVTVAGWVRSYFRSDGLTYTTTHSTIFGAAWGRGAVDFVYVTTDQSVYLETADSLAMERPAAGFEFQHNALDEGGPVNWSMVPPERDIGW